MREIKFRALMDREHPPHESRWVYLDGVGYDFWNSINGRYYGEILYDTLGQYTGLHDKNGKEIFEGDIVRCYVDDIEEISEVFFEMGCFVIRAKQNDPDYIPCLCTTDCSRTTETIGNIYENPELIE